MEAWHEMNESKLDRTIRVSLGVVLQFLGYGGVAGGGWGLAFKIIGFIPLITGLVGFRPLYALFKTGTRKS